MFTNIASKIYHEKITDIENRIPVKLNLSNRDKPSFSELLNSKVLENPIVDTVKDFDNIIAGASKKYNVPQSIIKSIISVESNFNPNTMSKAGAKGLMQLMPSTANHVGVLNVWDPKQNIEGGTKYFKELFNRYDEDLPLALAAYNAGPGNVDKYNGIPPFKETQNYVDKVLNNISSFI